MPVLTEQHSNIIVFGWKQTANVTDGIGYRGREMKGRRNRYRVRGDKRGRYRETKTEQRTGYH